MKDELEILADGGDEQDSDSVIWRSGGRSWSTSVFMLSSFDDDVTSMSFRQHFYCNSPLTSKSFRLAARVVRFHSIALTVQARHVDAFLRLYTKECSSDNDARPRLVHLCLYDTRERNQKEATIHQAVRQVLQLAGDDLQSLVLDDAFVDPAYPLVDQPFPSLHDLTFLWHRDPSTLIAPDSSISPLFPSLTRLHIVGGDIGWPEPKPFVPSWATHAPRLTHLRLSAYRLHSTSLNELQDALGTPAYPFTYRRQDPAVKPPPAQRAIPGLVHIVVQPGPKPATGWCGTARVAFGKKVMQLDWIAREATQAGVEMLVLPPCEWSSHREWRAARLRRPVDAFVCVE